MGRTRSEMIWIHTSVGSRKLGQTQAGQREPKMMTSSSPASFVTVAIVNVIINYYYLSFCCLLEVNYLLLQSFLFTRVTVLTAVAPTAAAAAAAAAIG